MIAILKRFTTLWNNFLYSKEDLYVLNIIRIGFALLLAVNILVMLQYIEFWFLESGALPKSSAKAILDPDAESLFFFLDDRFVAPLFLSMLASCVLLAAGVWPRLQALYLFITFNSMQHRAILLFDGEDTLFRLLAFYLFLMPLSAANSKDPQKRLLPVWSLRLLQFQVTLLYFSTAIEKSFGDHWRDGIAIYFVSRLDDLFTYRAWMAPMFDSLALVKAMTWSTLAFELVLPFALWYPRTRKIAVFLAIGFHLSLNYLMNLFLFQYLMILVLFSFLEKKDLDALKNAVVKITSKMLLFRRERQIA